MENIEWFAYRTDDLPAPIYALGWRLRFREKEWGQLFVVPASYLPQQVPVMIARVRDYWLPRLRAEGWAV
jgi:hypothetical protein